MGAKQPVRGLTLEIVRLPGRTPLLYFDVPASAARRRAACCSTAISTSSRRWSDGAKATALGSRCFEDGKLYGRGGADDGYAVFAALAAIGALQAQGIAHARCVGMIETCEESGSYDLPAYLDALAPRDGHRSISWSGSTPAAATTSGCGRRRRCADWPAAR